MRHREEPSPSPPDRRCRFCPSKAYRLGVRGRRIPGYPTSVDWHDVRAATRSSDQGRSSLVLFVPVVDDPHESATLLGLASLCRHYLCGGWLHSHWPLPRRSVFYGWGWSALVLFAASVLETPSSIACRRVHPSRMVHTGCQRHIHQAPVNVSYLQYNSDKSSVKRLPYSHCNTNKQMYSFTLGAGQPSLKACIR